MDGYELIKLLLTVLVLICLCHGWDVQVPESVTAVEGSCVTLPCSTSPHSDVIWYLYRKSSYPIVYSRKTEDIRDDFRGRTSAPGSSSEGNCSLRIDRVRPDENELKLYPWIHPDTGNKYHYIKINVVKPGNPEISIESPQVEGTLFSANCTVQHSCPSSPPRIEWFGPNPVTNNVITTVNQDGFWISVAQAKFRPNLEDLGRKLKCESVFNREHKPSKVLPLNILRFSHKCAHNDREKGGRGS
ncbi:myelin-associated glycoprotein-like isoform X3 [Astyanax mexicanus]|uniref:Myelin-associated glycoprotein-like isoform X3 n=1 Tax=Astyanax mexicanus TaxID=7994 RepID=A0A8T2MP70_ASTMX|nr:myelin-associated glycoprotein-like isoform X3 [Astyanax mexicanus]